MSFKNKVILITGGSSGIGAVTAELFAKEGGHVAVVGRNEANLKAVAEKCKKLGSNALVIKADMTKDEDVKRALTKTIEKYGQLDVLVNNAGVIFFGTILEENLMEHYDTIINTNLRSAVYLTSLAAPYLVKTKGNVINVSSVLGVSYLGDPNGLTYGISKAGLDHFTRGAALGLASSGVRVNAVSPGPTKTDILRAAGSDLSWEGAKEAFKIERVSEPEEIGDLILYLGSDKAKSITGSNFYIDNGTLLKN